MNNVYCLESDFSSAYLLNSNGRTLEEIKDNSIDCIITDHPWHDPKSNVGGNRNYIDYNTFKYTIEDFKTKYRVLKDGCYLVEFLPIETANNWEYLSKIKEMAKEAGFLYYCSLVWRKAKAGTRNTGRTTKETEQILIFSKGKAKRLSDLHKPYKTKKILPWEIDIRISKTNKNHKAEKPIELYEYLIENLTEQGDICLDQFGGSCNLIKASVNTNRNGIVFEKDETFIEKAVERFNMKKYISS